ncbi:hypothetical protein [Geminicoccus roseus]|uniref:hypothetical protein n=1 Tax=Geminicoccus roseus TaxID=404900 RepID=UPI000401A99D|nr:hypothetical protein [Geminicoccus roseus]
MRNLPAQDLEARLRQLLPLLTVLLAALLDLTPLPDVGPQGQAPDLMLAAVFFWSLHRPDLLPALGLFLVALGADLVAGSLIGLGPATLLLVREAVLRQQRLLRAASPLVRWAGFALSAAGVALAGWLVASAYARHWQAAEPVLGDLMLTVLFWPLVVVVLIQVQGMLPRARHAAGG